MKHKLNWCIALVCMVGLLTACNDQKEESQGQKPEEKAEVVDAKKQNATTSQIPKSESTEVKQLTVEPIETEFVNIRSLEGTLFELNQISSEDLVLYLLEYHKAQYPYKEEKEVEMLLLDYIGASRGTTLAEYQETYTRPFVQELERKLDTIRDEEMLHLGYLERDVLQRYLDAHIVYLESQRTHLKMQQVPAMLGLVSNYRNEAFDDPLIGPKFDRLEIESNPSVGEMRPINLKVATIFERLHAGETSVDVSQISKEIETFESYVDELFRQWEDSYAMHDGDEGEGEDYLMNFLQHGYERNFHKGLERELKRLEREVLPALSGEPKQALQTYVDYHFLLTQSLILYLEDMNAYAAEQAFYHAIANYWSQKAVDDDGKTYEGPYQQIGGILQADFSPLNE